ncbi:MAG: GntR family transcriptional regulator [Pseudomonadota bacterium]
MDQDARALGNDDTHLSQAGFEETSHSATRLSPKRVDAMGADKNWRDVYHAMHADLRADAFARGVKLPSQSELARRYGASRHAVRRALRAFSEEGVISCWQGREAVLVSRPVIYDIGHQTRLATGLRARGHVVVVSTVQTRQRRRFSPRIAAMLDMPPGAQGPFAEFMHHVDGVPTALGRHYFNARRFPNILEDTHGSDPSVPDAFSRNGVTEYHRAATFVEVRQPTAYEALALEIPPSQPVLCLLGQNVDQGRAPVEVTEAVVRGDTVTLQIEPHQVADLV